MAVKNSSLVVRIWRMASRLAIFTSETLLGHVGDQEFCWFALARRSSPSTRIVVTITGRSRKGSWSAKASAALGTTHVSICGPEKPRARRRSPRLRSGKST